MNTLQINDKYALLFGMSWLVLDSLESRNQRISALREQGARYCASFKRNDEENIGTTDEIGSHNKGSIVLSGAAQLASIPRFAGRNVIMLMEDPGSGGSAGLVAVVTLVKGSVSFDGLLSTSQAEAERQKFIDQCDQSSREYVICGQTSSIAPVNEPVDWDELLPQQINRFKTTPAVPVVPLKSTVSTQYAAIGLIAILMLAGGFMGYDKYTAYQKKKLAQEQARKVNPEVLYAASSQAFLAEPKVLLKDAIPAISARIGGLNAHLAGWRLTEVVCMATECGLRWERETGTFAEFTQAAPKDWTNIAYSDDGAGIANKMPLTVPQKPLPAKDAWVDKKSFQASEVSKWQRYSDVAFQFALSSMTLEAVPPGIAPEVLQNSPNAIHSTTWTVMPGAGWYMAKGLQAAPDYLTFESMRLVLGQKETTFEAKGKVYVKS